MNQFHDPVRQENYLRQCLAQDKRPLGLFLGAGCPLAVNGSVDSNELPLIPDIAGLTKAVFQKMVTSPEHESAFNTLLSHFQTDRGENPNVEDILTHIRSLRAVAGNDTVRGLKATDLDKLDEAICTTIVNVMDKTLPQSNTPYHKVAAWIGAIQRTEPVEIFTSNYDLLVEQALEANRVPYFDGFVGSYRTFFDPPAMEDDRLPARRARLWKLHGSINWRQDTRGIVSRGEPVVNDQRRVIHPSHLKYEESRRMPYLAMFDRLRAFLRKPSSVLIVSGYSFRDDHINEVMLQSLQGNSTAIIFALLFGKLQDYSHVVKFSTNRANLTVLAEDEAVIGTKRSQWMERQEIGELAHSLGVEWVVKENPVTKGIKQARFKLGDFARFGNLLEDLIGIEQEKERLTDAK